MEAAPTSTSRATHTMPTTTTLLPSYANAETDKIRDAFCAHNYGSLAKLPSELQVEMEWLVRVARRTAGGSEAW